jgi:predicted oxidoreductase
VKASAIVTVRRAAIGSLLKNAEARVFVAEASPAPGVFTSGDLKAFVQAVPTRQWSRTALDEVAV